MKEKKKAAIYPYNRKVSSLIKYTKLVAEYEISAAIVPKGYDADNKDLSVLEKTAEIGILGTTSFEEGIAGVDIFIVAEVECDEYFKKIIIRNIINVMRRGIDVISLFQFSEKEEIFLKDLANTYSVVFDSYRNFSDASVQFSNHHVETHAPIILVAGLNEECQKFDLQLQLRMCLQKAGYRVTQIGSKHYSELFGFHSFPSFMYDTSLTISEKIMGLNKYVGDLEEKEAPEVIIIGIPGGIMPISDKIHQNYGEIVYQTGYAIQSDFCIFAVPPAPFLEMPQIFQKVNSLLGAVPCCVGISNLRLNQEDTKVGYYDISLDIIELQEVENIISDLGDTWRVPLINISNNSKDILFYIIEEKIKKYYESVYSSECTSKVHSNDISDVNKWLEETVYRLFPDLERKLGIDQNWSALRAREVLYIVAEIALKFNILITAEDIYNGATYSYQSFLDNFISKMNME